jgi:long-chain-fatty-acid--CoA ligase ACSBG
MTYLIRITAEKSKLKPFYERFVSYLPLSHIAAQSVDIYCSIYIGGTTYFAQPDAFKGTLNQTLLDVRPTFFFAVPRVLEKIQDKLDETLNGLSGIKLKILSWARRVSLEHLSQGFTGLNRFSLFYLIAHRLFLSKIHKKLGLDKTRSIIRYNDFSLQPFFTQMTI